VPEQLLASLKGLGFLELVVVIGGMMRWAGHIANKRVDKSGYVIIVGKSKEKRYLHGMVVL
jgi:hypothetical protein